MKITLKGTKGMTAVLCDHGKDGPSGLTILPVRKIDIVEYVQGNFAKPIDRGNVLNQLSFTASTEHDSVTAAQLWMLFLGVNVPAAGDLEIELENKETVVVIRNVTCEITPLPLVGILSTVQYAIKFGHIDEAVQVFDQDGQQILTSDAMKIFVNKE